jgi:hypothetical protein
MIFRGLVAGCQYFGGTQAFIFRVGGTHHNLGAYCIKCDVKYMKKKLNIKVPNMSYFSAV